MTKTRDLTKGSIYTHLKAIAIPASIGFFFQTMYNIVDTIYAGLISTQAQAALALSFPIFFLIIAMGSGIGTATSVLIANALGEKKKPGLFAVQCFSFAICISFIVAIIGFFSAPSLFTLLGAESDYLNLSLSYMNIILFATPLFLLKMTISQSLTAQGDSLSFRNILILGFFLNIILNPIFMFGFWIIPAMGLQGVALSTVLVQALGVIYLAYKLKKTGLLARRNLVDYIPLKKYFAKISYQAFPASLNMMTVAIGIFIITYFVSQFGESAVAAYGIATRIEQILLLPAIGLNFAIISLVGQNNGAKKFERVKDSYYIALKFGLALMTISTIVLFFFGELLFRIFTQDEQVINIGVNYLRIAAFLTWAYIILFQTVSLLQGLKRPMFALWIGVFRQIIAPILLFWFFVFVLDLGLDGVWWGIFLVTWIAAFITLFYGYRVFHQKILKKVE
ncbi:MAG: MATE family efflux transporter [Candidatus Woesearchaeota archaeon]